jgi:hypothetical protein
MAGEIELQALRIRHGGEVNATRLEQQAMLQRMAGGAAATGGWVRGGSLLLTGVTSAYGSYINPSGYTKDDDE